MDELHKQLLEYLYYEPETGLFTTEEEAREAYVKAKRANHLTWSENV